MVRETRINPFSRSVSIDPEGMLEPVRLGELRDGCVGLRRRWLRRRLGGSRLFETKQPGGGQAQNKFSFHPGGSPDSIRGSWLFPHLSAAPARLWHLPQYADDSP
jgi:hypothetical protein